MKRKLRCPALNRGQARPLPQRSPVDCSRNVLRESAALDSTTIIGRHILAAITACNNRRFIIMTSILNIARHMLLSSAGIVAALLMCALPLDAQEPAAMAGSVPADSTLKDSTMADSTIYESRDELWKQLPPGFMDSTSTILPVLSGEKRKSPGGALLRSLALPGWGQFYTRHPVRGTVTAIAETAFFAGMIIKFSDRADLRDKLSAMEAANGPEWPVDDPERVLLNSQIKSAQQKGGDYLAYGATALVLGMLDSYVSAHLYNFDRHFALAPSGSGRITLSFQF